jgi:hypothetical protein
MRRHTFLFEPAVWLGAGTFWRGDGEALPASTFIEVAHRPEVWLLSGAMTVRGSPPVEFVHARRIAPAMRESGTMRWTSEDATLGAVRGTFAVVGDCILSVHRGLAGGYHGSESFGVLDEESYRCAGVLLLDERCLSSWQMLLKRDR